jgi:hypothetical protein
VTPNVVAEAACDSKNILKAGHECTLYTGKIGLERRGKSVQKFDAAFGTMVRIIKCFRKGRQKRYIKAKQN